MLFFLLGRLSTLKMEVTISSETLAHIQTAWGYIQEDGNIHNYSCEKLKSYKEKLNDVINAAENE
jgi:hypothetical protein